MELQKIQIFSYIDAETIRMLEDIFVSQAIPKGDFLIHFDEEVPGLYILEKGEVTVLAQDGKTALAVLAEWGILR